jgi:hypothetical protein
LEYRLVEFSNVSPVKIRSGVLPDMITRFSN